MEDSVAIAERPEKTVSSDLIRGHINTIILRSLYDGDKYGYEIIAEIEQKSHGQYSLKQPSLYSALKRLEKDGYVTSYWGGSVGGGRRKYFSLTEAGKAISEQNQAEWEYSRTVIDSLISDKDFDFSNPAPTAVNMRVLKETTSRVPRGEGSDDELDYEPSFDDAEELGKLEARYREQLKDLEDKRSDLDRREQAFEESMRTRNDAIIKERDWRESEIAAREQALAQKRAELETLRAQQAAEAAEASRKAEDAAQQLRLLQQSEQEVQAAQAAQTSEEENARRQELLDKISSLEYELRESEAALDNARRQNELLAQEEHPDPEAVENERAEYEAKIKALETERDNQHVLYQEKLTQALEEERKQHQEDLKAQEARILAEQEELFRNREQQLLHRNYIDLVNTPPANEAANDYNYYTAPAPTAEEPQPEPRPVEDYKSVVHRLYANAVTGDAATPHEERAKSLDGIDFSDLEARAAQDGIHIRTAGSKSKAAANDSASLVHKGKALFLSGIVTFLFCVALGSVLLGISASATIPAFYPYLLWGIGLAVLLVTGLAYANRYGERSLRRTGPVILNVIVTYILLVIVTLIVALSARMDFTDPVQLTAWVAIPVVAFLGVILFGVVYYLQVRPKKD